MKFKRFQNWDLFPNQTYSLTVQMHKHHMNYKGVVIWHRFTRFNFWPQSLIFWLTAKIACVCENSLVACDFQHSNSQPPNKPTLGLEHAGILNALDWWRCEVAYLCMTLCYWLSIHTLWLHSSISFCLDSCSQDILIHQYYDNEGNVPFLSVLLSFQEKRFSEGN